MLIKPTELPHARLYTPQAQPLLCKCFIVVCSLALLLLVLWILADNHDSSMSSDDLALFADRLN